MYTFVKVHDTLTRNCLILSNLYHPIFHFIHNKIILGKKILNFLIKKKKEIYIWSKQTKTFQVSLPPKVL